ncbi:hypothetical protein LDENG_00157050 [Lucifuga dentata]|nr:hypothetical protein LDENG_00157050 [Lucifuga dentata]
MVYKEGGIRDRVRLTMLALETRLRVQLWPRTNPDEDGEEMQEVQDEEGMVERGSQKSDSNSDEQEERSNLEEYGDTKGNGGDTSDDNSSLEGSEVGEKARLTDKGEPEGKREGKGETVGDEEGKREASGGAGLLIDLKQFSGSAIWSEEDSKDGKGGDVTAL